jgi:cysteinyl-tRNA synthetase
MSNHFLGPSFDIHGGGKDLLFPHHENERAQSIAATGGAFAKYWVHNGFVRVESEKMSKSLGNYLTIRDALARFHPEVLRLSLLSKHYRSPLDFSQEAVLDLQSGIVRIYRTLQRLEKEIGPPVAEAAVSLAGSSVAQDGSPFLEQFVEAMDDDLNTAQAIGLIFQMVREMNRLMDEAGGSLDESIRLRLVRDRAELKAAAEVLGFLEEDSDTFFDQLAGSEWGSDPVEIEKMIQERAAARKTRNWTKADEIREELKRRGIILEDGPQGTSWRFDV